MNILFTILGIILFLAVFIFIIFLQDLLTKRHMLLGLILPLISLCNSIIIDTEMISSIIKSYLGPRTIEEYRNNLLVSKTTIITKYNLPVVIFTLVYFNIATIILFIIFFASRKKAQRKKELDKMRINDLE